MNNVRAILITIGDELLIGQTIDTNSAWMAQQLNAIGIEVVRRVAVADQKEAIIAALDEESSKASIILMTGGLGPTSDDITKPVLCDYFGGKMVVNERVLEHVKAIFSRRNRPFLESNMKQAEVPDVCDVMFNSMGTAPGMWFEKDGKIYVSMPGVPFEMEYIMTEEVLPRLSTRFVSDAIVHRTLITAGEGESFIAEKIKDFEAALPAYIRLAYLPSPGSVKLRLTGRGADGEKLSVEVEAWHQKFAERLYDITIATEDLPIEAIVGAAFAGKNKTVGLAESCTGGYIAHKFTQVPGSSNYFQGSVVCYSVDVKVSLLGIARELIDDAGVVSEPVAEEMAKRARTVLNADYGLGVTGLLSPDDSYTVSPGTVCIAVANKDKVVSKTFQFYYDRIRNKELAVQYGFLLLWKFLNERI
ncbi:CinA family nicotinamide mononucleotide deamidase-related protein [Taibaiella soli]|uniref:CinA-like protein n=1 Tax=Taibaiella soli TaxID=1649169 RepID=A0A2W2BL73_9BACT|nr:CinA family nicotinamide mononucleotide deamidase-related protein [Taibaiella soli]PZF74176.1 damage-inducible protein CinA [Taibaiella soli]